MSSTDFPHANHPVEVMEADDMSTLGENLNLIPWTTSFSEYDRMRPENATTHTIYPIHHNPVIKSTKEKRVRFETATPLRKTLAHKIMKSKSGNPTRDANKMLHIQAALSLTRSEKTALQCDVQQKQQEISNLKTTIARLADQSDRIQYLEAQLASANNVITSLRQQVTILEHRARQDGKNNDQDGSEDDEDDDGGDSDDGDNTDAGEHYVSVYFSNKATAAKKRTLKYRA